MNGNRNQKYKTRRRIQVLLIVIIGLLLVWQFDRMVRSFRASNVSYGSDIIEPYQTNVCPGDTLSYPLVAETLEFPSLLHIVEGWCETGETGVCYRSLSTEYFLPILDYRRVSTDAKRIVPNLPPGDYEFWHVTHSCGGTVNGYRVPFTVPEGCGG